MLWCDTIFLIPSIENCFKKLKSFFLPKFEFSGKKTSKYVQRTIQDVIIQTMALRVLWEVSQNIENIDFYSIMCNEATDIKNVF